MNNLKEDEEYDSEFMKYIFGKDNSYSKFVNVEGLNVESPSYRYNKLLKEIDTTPNWCNTQVIEELENELNEIKNNVVGGSEKDKAEYYIKTYNLVVIFERMRNYNLALSLIDSVLESSKKLHVAYKISFLMAKANIQYDLYLEGYESITWLHEKVLPIIESISQMLLNTTFPPTLLIAFQYRLLVFVALYSLESGSTTSTKKTVLRLQSYLPEFPDYISSLSAEVTNERLRDFTNPSLFLLSQASSAILNYNPMTLRGVLDYYRGNYKKVVSLSFDTMDTSTLSLLASCEFALGHRQKALCYYQQILQKEKEVSFMLGRVYRNLAMLYIANQQIQEGTKCMKYANLILPINSQLLYDDIFVSLQQPPEQWEFLELLYQLLKIEGQPSNVSPSQFIQMTLWKIELFQEANADDQIIEECKRLLQQKICSLSQHRQIVLILVETFCSKRRLKEALECLSAGCAWVEYPEGVQKGIRGEDCSEEEKEYAGDVLYNRIQIYIELKDWKNALECAQLYHTFMYNYSSLQLYTHCLVLAGEGKKAMDLYEKYTLFNSNVCFTSTMEQNETVNPQSEVKETEVTTPQQESISNATTESESKGERKPFNIEEELKKPYVVGIKKEYVLPVMSEKRNNSIISESGQGKTYKTKRSREDLGLKKRSECNDLCRSIAKGKECQFGDSCKYNHDVAGYFSQREPDISPICPVFEAHGYCPVGLNCRWAGSHTSSDFKILSKPETEQTPIIELNSAGDIPQQIRKKTYVYEKSSWTEQPVGALGEAEMKSIDFANKIYIAPLTTVGNLPFRRVCVDYGADITCSEMILTGNFLHSQTSEWALLRRHPSEKIFGVQVASGRPDEVNYVTEILRREMQVDFVDLNAGCPIDVLERMGAGAALLQRPNKLKRILASMLDSAETLPVVCKLRVGEKDNTIHKIIPDLQAMRGRKGNRLNAITIHGRTKIARYTKTADWDYIDQCAMSQSADLPRMQVIGNGDIFDNEMYYNQLNNHHMDGIMIGRGALIKPWICTEIKENRHWDISAGERLEIIKKFCDYGLEHWGSDEQGVSRTRRFLLEWLSFLCRYVPYGLLERPQTINQRPFAYVGRSDLETLLGSTKSEDWVKISTMFLGPVPDDFVFLPKHKSNAYTENYSFVC